MKLLLLVNNWVGWQITEYLARSDAQVGGLVLHPASNCKMGSEIRMAASLPDHLVFDGSKLRESSVIGSIRAEGYDMAVSASFGYILRKQFLEMFPKGCINVHPSLLPHGRGASPNVWNIIEGTPAGVSIHLLDESVDTGPIIAQQAVSVLNTDTAKTLYERLEAASVGLFKDAWPRIASGGVALKAQPKDGYAAHRDADLKTLGEIELDKLYTGEQLINILRARTFPPYPGAYYVSNGQRVYVRIELYSDESRIK